MTRYLSARAIAGALAMPWRDLEPALERAGVRILRVVLPTGARRIRVEANGYERFLAEASRPELPGRDRAELAARLAEEELGLPPRRRKESRG